MADTMDDDSRMPLWQHLEDLRGCLIRSVVAVIVGVLAVFSFSDKVVLFLQRPLLAVLPEDAKQLYFTGIADQFVIYVKVSVIVAFALTSPYILYQVWRFVAPGLYDKERAMALPFVFIGSLSFLSGLAFCYWVILPFSFDFLINFGSEQNKAIITLTSYFSFTLKMLFGIGLLFELPVCLLLLGMLGVLDAETLAKYRRHAIIVLLVLSAVLTPPDVLSQIIVVGPLWLLYELSIVGVKFVNRSQHKAREKAKAEQNAVPDDAHNESD